MNAFPLELAVLLIIGAALLIRSVYNKLRSTVASMPVQVDPADRADRGLWAQAEDESEARAVVLARPAAPAPVRSTAGANSGASSRALAAQIARRTPRRARRFSRAALLPDRRALQDAIVIAAIVQPCHALRERDTD